MSGKAGTGKKATAKKAPAEGKKAEGKKGKAAAKNNKEAEAGKKRTGPAPAGEGPPLKKRGLLAKDLPMMMYGYGDAQVPYEETIQLVEDITVDYITALMTKALDAATGPNQRITVEDILFVLRKDKRKYARAKELLEVNELITKAKKVDGLADEGE